MIKLKNIIFSDVDGTLLNSKHEITTKTLNILKEKIATGTYFAIVSARSPSGIYPIVNTYNLKCFIISYSGALILDENREVIFSKGMTKKNAQVILDFIEHNKLDLSWCVYSMDDWIVKSKLDPRIIREEKIVKAKSNEGDLSFVTNNIVNKILCICNPDKILSIEDALKNRFPDFSIVKSSPILLEIMEKGINKAEAIKILCDKLNVSCSNTIAFGDNYNDLEMLKFVNKGFLMGNAPDELKNGFPNHTLSNDEDGIYYALKGLEKYE